MIEEIMNEEAITMESASEKVTKSVITCDLEGRIETFNKGAEEIFGYASDEVVGKKRVSLFSPGLVVLQNVPGWLQSAVDDGAYEGRTTFVRKDGSSLAAQIKITPTFKDGEQIGYCGVTVPLPEVDPEETMPKISPFTRIFAGLVITRAPFLTATLVPVLIGAAWAYAMGGASPFPWGLFALTLVGALALHVAANTFNDYFDWTSGTDENNNDYFLPFSGGSRSIELGLISEKGLFRVALFFSALATLCGGLLLFTRGWPIVALGMTGLFAAYFYTAPPLRLVARKGLGELFIGLCFGPLMVGGSAFALTGAMDPWAFLAGIPVGLLTTAILWINEFPDYAGDKVSGKNNLVVVLGKENARYGYALLMLTAFGGVVLPVFGGVFPSGTLLTLLALPLAFYATRKLFREFNQRSLIKGNSATIVLQLVAGLLFFTGVLFNARLADVFGF
jgi:1,4-dihydroxy-2-naphthoate octaprenyltransferase